MAKIHTVQISVDRMLPDQPDQLASLHVSGDANFIQLID